MNDHRRYVSNVTLTIIQYIHLYIIQYKLNILLVLTLLISADNMNSVCSIPMTILKFLIRVDL